MVRYVITGLVLLLTVSFGEVKYEVKHRGNETVFRQVFICYSPDGRKYEFLHPCPEGFLGEPPKEKTAELIAGVRRCRDTVHLKCLNECGKMKSILDRKKCAERCYALLGMCVDGIISGKE